MYVSVLCMVLRFFPPSSVSITLFCTSVHFSSKVLGQTTVQITTIFFFLLIQGVFQDLTFFFLGGIFFFLGQKKILPRGRPPPKHCT